MKISGAPRRVAFAGVMGAAALTALYLSSILPTMKLVCLAVTTFCTAVLVAENEYWAAAICFIGVSLLGLLIVPDKLRLLPYIGFFGWYPIVKGTAERLRPLFAWLIKLAAYAVGFIAISASLGYLIPISDALPLWAVGIIGAAVFAAMDTLLGICIGQFFLRLGRSREEGRTYARK